MNSHDVDPKDWQDAPYDNEIDLGNSHYLTFYRDGEEGQVLQCIVDEDLWRATEHKEGVVDYVLRGQPILKDGRPATGGILRHKQPKSPTGWCESAFRWWVRPNWPSHSEHEQKQHTLELESLEPLTVSPSLLCKAPMPDGSTCDDHGFIRNGKWVGA